MSVGVSLQADCALQVCLGFGSIPHVSIAEGAKGVGARMPAVELNRTAELCDGPIEVTEIVVGETALRSAVQPDCAAGAALGFAGVRAAGSLFKV